MGINQIFVEDGDKTRPHLKCVDGASTGKNTFGKGVGLGVDVEDLGLVAGFYPGNDPGDKHGGGCDAKTNESELPMHNERHDEGCDESREALKRKSQFFADTALYESSVGGGLCRDGASDAEIVEGNLLAESGSDVLVTDVPNNSVTGIGK